MIELYHSKIVITNYYNEELLENTKKLLSVWDPVNFKYNFKAYKYNKEEQTLTLPSGLNLDKLINEMDSDNLDTTIINKKPRRKRLNKTIDLKFPPKNNLQKDAIKFLLDNHRKTNGTHKFLSLNTGEGKTYCALNYLIKSKDVPIIFVDQENLLNQWKESIFKFTDTTEEEVYTISGMDSIESILAMDDEEIKNIKYFIAIHRTISNLLNDIVLFNEFFNKISATIKVYDEAHVEIVNIFNIDCELNLPSLYITATPSRSNFRENSVYKLMIETIPIYRTPTYYTEKYVNVIIYQINTKPSLSIQSDMNGKYGFNGNNFSSYMEKEAYNIFNKEIIRILFGMIEQINNPDAKTKKTALIFQKNSTLEKFYNSCKNIIEKHNFNYSIGILNGKTKVDDRKKVLNDTDIIFTTNKSLGKALDIADLECVINLVPASSNTLTEQSLGRLRKLPGKEVYYFDIVDIGFENCKNQLFYRKRIYRKKAKEIKEVFYDSK